MINKEMIEDAANKYLQTELELERVLGLEYIESDVVKENILTDFKAGAEWAIEQMSNDAIELLDWLKAERIVGHTWIEYEDGTRISDNKQLYQLYLNNKTK